MGLILRVVDEIRFGVRELDIDELDTLAWMWSRLNDGVTPAEAALDALGADGDA
jgi:hypothetical protein